MSPARLVFHVLDMDEHDREQVEIRVKLDEALARQSGYWAARYTWGDGKKGQNRSRKKR